MRHADERPADAADQKAGTQAHAVHQVTHERRADWIHEQSHLFQLAGAGNGNVLDQVVMINAYQFIQVDKTSIPTGALLGVKGTPLDFTNPMAIGARIHSNDAQPGNAQPIQGGYDFNWVLNNPGDLNALAVRVTDPVSGRRSKCIPPNRVSNSILSTFLIIA